MRCTSCDYPLWNLKARTCPECGSPFLPSEHDFVINSVCFCCPHCDQGYYGTAANGHLEPAEFDCVHCGRQIHMDQMVLRPTEGVTEKETLIEPHPWLGRASRGWVRAWLATAWRALVRPHRLMQDVPDEGASGPAWIFAILCAAAFPVVSLLPLFLLVGTISLFASGGADMIGVLMSGLATCAVVAGFYLCVLVLWGFVTHVMLKITGGAARPIARTYQCLCYSLGALAPTAVPCIGTYPFGFVGWMWCGISAIFAVASGQRVHGGRAALAVLTFPVLVVLLGAGGYLALIMAVVSGTGPFGAISAVIAPPQETMTLTSSILQYAASHDGAGPGHAVQLVTAQGLGVANFVSQTTTTTSESNIPLGESTLADFQLLPTNRRSMAAQDAADALPPRVVAHRLGDFVFTYHGIDLTAADGKLWIVIYSPDPAQNPGGVAQPFVGLADGSITRLTGNLSTDLAAQNARRARYGLAPLPDPATVTHVQPAVGPAKLNEE